MPIIKFFLPPSIRSPAPCCSLCHHLGLLSGIGLALGLPSPISSIRSWVAFFLCCSNSKADRGFLGLVPGGVFLGLPSGPSLGLLSGVRSSAVSPNPSRSLAPCAAAIMPPIPPIAAAIVPNAFSLSSNVVSLPKIKSRPSPIAFAIFSPNSFSLSKTNFAFMKNVEIFFVFSLSPRYFNSSEVSAKAPIFINRLPIGPKKSSRNPNIPCPFSFFFTFFCRPLSLPAFTISWLSSADWSFCLRSLLLSNCSRFLSSFIEAIEIFSISLTILPIDETVPPILLSASVWVRAAEVAGFSLPEFPGFTNL